MQAASGTITPEACPQGFYCPDGTANYGLFPCPLGTFGAAPSLTDADGCSACTATNYCPEAGMTDSTVYTCQNGYMCDVGSDTSTGTDSCDDDNYCVGGVSTLCPAGTYSVAGGLVD